MPTIYAIFKSKRGVLAALVDEALPQKRFTALVDEGMRQESAEKHIEISAKMARQIYDAEKELIDILRGASVLSLELKELEQEREKRRYERQGESAKKLMEQTKLSPVKIRDILWAFTGRDMYRLFIIERGWSSDAYETWLAETLKKLLLQ